jgi:hypothetical protein
VPIKVLEMDLLKKDATRISASTGCNSFIEEMVRQVKDYRLAKRVKEDPVRVSMA